MDKRMIVLIALAVLAMVGFASAAETVDELEIRGSIVDTAAGISPVVATWTAGELQACTWYAYSFAAFWYDLDDDLSTETLTIDTAANVGGHGPLAVWQRVIDEGELIYRTVPGGQAFVACKELAATSPNLRIKGAESEPFFDYDGDGIPFEPETCYNVVGWMAERYTGVKGRADTLAKLLVEFEGDDKKTLATGEEWDLGGGFSLIAKEIHPEGNTVWLQLNKSGTEINSTIVGRQNPTAQDMLYVVTIDDVGGQDNVPIFVAYVDGMIKGTDTNLVQLKYVWLISDEAIEIECGDEFGALEVTMTSPYTVILENNNSITLTEDEVVDVYGDVKFKVADDSNTIRFYPMVEKTEPGTYEIRGSIVDTTTCTAPGSSVCVAGDLYCCTWCPYDFDAFWYDLDDDLSTETLTIDTGVSATSGPIGLGVGSSRTLDEKELIYNTGPQLLAYELTKAYNGVTNPIVTVKGAEDEALGAVNDKNGDGLGGDIEVCYAVVGWWAEKYIGINGRADKLAKLLVEFTSTDKKTLATGEEWDLGGGFSLIAKEIHPEGNTVWLQLNKSGTEINSTIVGRQNPTAQDMLYVVTIDDVGGQDNVPIFVAYVDGMIKGTETNLVQLKYVWLISDEVTEISSGDTFGKFKIGTCGAARVTAENEDTITLSENTVIDLYGGMKIKVADDVTSVRFYPFVERIIGGEEPPPPPETIPATDTDCDGVPDVWDLDNSTPAGYWVNPQGIGRMWGDMNGDGWRTSVDALMILRAAVGKIEIG